MKILYLIRHAKSSWKFEDQEDFERGLNSRGKNDLKTMGHRLSLNVRPDFVLCSPAVRAKKTLKKLAQLCGIKKEIINYEERLYLANVSTLYQLISGLRPDVSVAWVIGHNPGLTEFANDLGQAKILNIPTLGIVRIDISISDWSEIKFAAGQVTMFDYPKKLT